MHMYNEKSIFNDLDETYCQDVSVGNGESADVLGKGTITARANVRAKKNIVAFKEMLYVPDLMCNLVSISRLRKAGCRILFDDDENGNGICYVIVRETNTVMLVATECKQNGLYEVLMNPFRPSQIESDRAEALVAKADPQVKWHERLGHACENTIRKSIPLVKGIKLEKVQSIPLCEPCKLGKSTRSPRPEASDDARRSTRPLELMHCDMVGPIRHPSHNNSH